MYSSVPFLSRFWMHVWVPPVMLRPLWECKASNIRFSHLVGRVTADASGKFAVRSPTLAGLEAKVPRTLKNEMNAQMLVSSLR